MNERKTPEDLDRDRILVRAPNQAQWAVSIRSERLTIGCSADNDLTLYDSKLFPQHARIELRGTHYQVTALESENDHTFTFLGEVELLRGYPEPWTPDQLLRVGDHVLELERSRKEATAPEVGTSSIQSRAGEERVAVTVETTELSVEPGSRTSFSLIITNRSSVVDHFWVSVRGIQAGWVPDKVPELRLLPGERQEVRIEIQPPRSPQSRAGQYPITIQVGSRDDPDYVVVEKATLTVAAYSPISCDLRPQKQSGSAEARFMIGLNNQGNSNLAIEFEARDPEDLCQYIFDPPVAVVPAGEERTVTLAVQTEALEPDQKAKTHPFTITAQPVGAPELARQVHGVWEQVPLQSVQEKIVPPRSKKHRFWHWILVVLVVAAMVICVLLLLGPAIGPVYENRLFEFLWGRRKISTMRRKSLPDK